MTRNLDIDGLNCLCADCPGNRIVYILYPMDILAPWIESAAARYSANIAVITGMDWQNVFSPWPAKGIPPGTPDFEGRAPEFLGTLRTEVLPAVERMYGIAAADRTLVGVSMSGLFAMWQWMVCDVFTDLVSLSGSFWYPGFTQWIESQPIPRKSGRCVLLLGEDEPKSRVTAYRSVGADTRRIENVLTTAGIDVSFIGVPGNHFSDPTGRLDKALAALGR